jgi:hypothetical protein
MPALAPAADGQADDRRGDEHRDEVHDLEQRVDGRAGGVLERVTDGVTDDGGRVGRGALAAVSAVFDDLLGVVPRPTGVGEEDGHEAAGGDGAREEAREGADAHAEPDDDRREGGEQTGGGQLTQRVAGADVDDLAVFGLGRALHDPGDLADLAAHLEDDRARARVTALIARPEKRNTTEAPMSAPTRVTGETISVTNENGKSARSWRRP